MNEWLVQLKDLDTKSFLDCIETMEKNKVDITDRSTKGEKSIQYNFYGDKTKLASYFINYIKKIENINHVVNANDVTGAWIVEGKKGSYHRLHNHSLNKKDSEYSNGLSCVLYLDVPDDEQSEFYFLLHKGNNIECKSIQPDKGDLIIMPKSVFHGVYPQTSDGLRRTLNIDFKYAN